MSQVSIEIIEDKENVLLERREIVCIFKDAGGRLKREDAVNAIKEYLKIEDKVIVPIKMTCETGKDDLKATFHVYDSIDVARKYLQEHILRRARLIEEKKEE